MRLRLFAATIVAVVSVAIAGSAQSAPAQSAGADSTAHGVDAVGRAPAASITTRGPIPQPTLDRATPVDTNTTPAKPADTGVFSTGVLLAAALVIGIVYALSRTLGR